MGVLAEGGNSQGCSLPGVGTSHLSAALSQAFTEHLVRVRSFVAGISMGSHHKARISHFAGKQIKARRG